jgi:transposase
MVGPMSGSYARAEVLPGPGRRRRWPLAEKLAMVDASRETGATGSLVARRHSVSPNQLFTWRRLAEQGALTATQAEEEAVPGSAFRAQQDQIREVHRLLAQKTLETEILKEALDLTDSRVVRNPAFCRGRCAGWRALVTGIFWRLFARRPDN